MRKASDAVESAFALEMPPAIPHTEYSAHFHWDLVQAVTGIHVTPDSTPAQQQAASSAFVKAWQYGFMYNTPLDQWIFGEKRTKMGHAVYMEGGVDFDTQCQQLFEDPEDLFEFDFDAAYEHRTAAEVTAYFNQNYRSQIEKYPDCVNTTGIYVSCMSGMIELCGWDTLLLAAGIDSQAFGEVMERYSRWLMTYIHGLAACEAPIVSIHDDMVWGNGPFMSLEWYRTYLIPQLKRYFAVLHEAGKKVLFICDGNYTPLIDDLAAAGADGFVMEPTTDLAYMAERYGRTHVMVGNLDTRILLSCNREEIDAEVRRCVEIGRNCPGYILAVGNHIPPNTPVEGALMFYDSYQKWSKR